MTEVDVILLRMDSCIEGSKDWFYWQGRLDRSLGQKWRPCAREALCQYYNLGFYDSRTFKRCSCDT